MTGFDLSKFDSPGEVCEHLMTLPAMQREGILLQLRMDALAAVCAEPTPPSPQQQDATQRLRGKYAAMLR